MENHHFKWENPLYVAIFNSFFYVYQAGYPQQTMTCEFTRCLHGPHGPHALRSGHHPQRLEEWNLVPGAAWGCSNSWSKSYQECFATYTSIHTWHCFRNEHETRCACVNGGHSVVTAVFLEVGETPGAYERPKPAKLVLDLPWSKSSPPWKAQVKIGKTCMATTRTLKIVLLAFPWFFVIFQSNSYCKSTCDTLWLLLISHSYGKSPLFIDKSSIITWHISHHPMILPCNSN
jgi:hypothetical protein